ncbi:MAG: L-rhamnose/proton symporter RhaT [Terracidiphilus sp.]
MLTKSCSEYGGRGGPAKRVLAENIDGGALVPLIFRKRAVLGASSGALILSGLGVMVAGIVLSARAGSRREQGVKKETGGGYAMALALAILCGILAPMINYSFVFGQEIARATQLGVSPIRAPYTVWPVTLAGGLLPNLAYCLFLLAKNNTWKVFRGPWLPDAGFAVLMAVLWMGALAVYGVASVCLGVLGTSVGWGLIQIFTIMTANCGGLLAGEWTAAPVSAKCTDFEAVVHQNSIPGSAATCDNLSSRPVEA